MSESAARLDDQELGARIRGQLVCYARAVRHPEWGPMDVGERAPLVSVWADRFEEDLATLKYGGDAETGRIIDLDSERASARVNRITESSPTMINDLDQPCSGFNRLEPTDLEHAEDRIEAKLGETSAQSPLCDENGEPSDLGGTAKTLR